MKSMNTPSISRQTTTAATRHKSNPSTPKGAASGMSSVTFYRCKEGTFWDCQSQRSANALPKRKFSSYCSQQNIFTRFSTFTILILKEDRWSRDTRHSCRDPSDIRERCSPSSISSLFTSPAQTGTQTLTFSIQGDGIKQKPTKTNLLLHAGSPSTIITYIYKYSSMFQMWLEARFTQSEEAHQMFHRKLLFS